MSAAPIQLTEEFETITCRECGHEFLLFAVLRYYEDPCYEEEVRTLPQVDAYYCPYCGTKKPRSES